MNGVRQRNESDPPGQRSDDLRRGGHKGVVVACLALAGATVLASGCSGGTPAGQAPKVTTTMPTGGVTSTAAPAPTKSPPRAPSAGAPTGGATLPFVADTRPDASDVREGFPVLTTVSKGLHDGYVRYVFTFTHLDPEGHQPGRQFARPAWDARYVPQSEAVMDGSGHPVFNAGFPAHLRIRFQANMHDTDGKSTLEKSIADEEGMVFGGDFEGAVNWFYGSRRERPFRVEYVGDGRVVVDVVT